MDLNLQSHRAQVYESVLLGVHGLLAFLGWAVLCAFASAAACWWCGYLAPGWGAVRPVRGARHGRAAVSGSEERLRLDVERGIRDIERYLSGIR